MTEVPNPYSMPFAASVVSTSSDTPPVTTPDSIDNPNTMSSHIPIPSSAPLTVVPPATVATDDHKKQLMGEIALRFNTSPASLSVLSIPKTAPSSTPYFPSKESFRLDPADYADLVMEETEKSIRDAMNRMRFGFFFKDAWSQWTVAQQFTPQQIEEIDHMTLSDLCRIAFRIMFKASTFEKYVYAGVCPIT
jgi:hypothetical protein